MTIGEGVRAYKAYEERRKDAAYFSYTGAMTTALFVSSMFGSKSPPPIYEIYPELFKRDEEVEEQIQESKSAANFINFANAFNRKFDNGDRKSESENNGSRLSGEG